MTKRLNSRRKPKPPAKVQQEIIDQAQRGMELVIKTAGTAADHPLDDEPREQINDIKQLAWQTVLNTRLSKKQKLDWIAGALLAAYQLGANSVPYQEHRAVL